METEEGSILVQQVLEDQKKFVEETLQEKGIKATVFIPVVVINGKVCHMNGVCSLKHCIPVLTKYT